jgi:hypothetical protein
MKRMLTMSLSLLMLVLLSLQGIGCTCKQSNLVDRILTINGKMSRSDDDNTYKPLVNVPIEIDAGTWLKTETFGDAIIVFSEANRDIAMAKMEPDTKLQTRTPGNSNIFTQHFGKTFIRWLNGNDSDVPIQGFGVVSPTGSQLRITIATDGAKIAIYEGSALFTSLSNGTTKIDINQELVVPYAGASTMLNGYSFTKEEILSFQALGGVVPPNSTLTEPTSLPDLTFGTGSPTVVPTAVIPKGTIKLSDFRIENRGKVNSGTFSIGFYLSPDVIITTDDIYLADSPIVDMEPGEQRTLVSGLITIPDKTPAGNYYVGILLDQENTVSESDENNNFVTTQITVSPPDVTFTITVQGNGTIDPEPGIYSFYGYGHVHLIAKPNTGSYWIGWMLDGKTENLNPITVESDGHYLKIYNASDVLMKMYTLDKLGNVTIIASFK